MKGSSSARMLQARLAPQGQHSAFWQQLMSHLLNISNLRLHFLASSTCQTRSTGNGLCMCVHM